MSTFDTLTMIRMSSLEKVYVFVEFTMSYHLNFALISSWGKSVDKHIILVMIKAMIQ